MKQLITIFALLACLNSAKGLSFTVTACSFQDSSIVPYSSSQWVDIKSSGSYTSADHLKIYLSHMVGANTTTYTAIFDQVFYSYFLNLPVNADGSRRIYFTMPASYLTGMFQLSVNIEMNTYRYGIFSTTTGLQYQQQAEKTVLKINLYNQNGQPVQEPVGLYFKETIYNDGSKSLGKFFNTGLQ